MVFSLTILMLFSAQAVAALASIHGDIRRQHLSFARCMDGQCRSWHGILRKDLWRPHPRLRTFLTATKDGPSEDASEIFTLDRRTVLRCAPAAGLIATLPPKAARADSLISPSNRLGVSVGELGNGLLECRVLENVMSPPPYGLEAADVLYPDWFAGVWTVSSVATDVQAPCGLQLFGGNSTYAAARREIGPENALRYRARFVRSGDAVVADRDFNVREIAKAAMGSNAVVDVSLATPNKFSCVLSPMGAGTLLSVDLITLARRQENVDRLDFHCSEVVRQIVAPTNSNKPQTSVGPPQVGAKSPLLKEIETASLYTAVEPKAPGGEITEIKCRQRSATFLLPSQQDPLAYQLWQMSRGRPIDVRFYDVTYTKNI